MSLAIDGSVHYHNLASTSTPTISLTTSQANDIIILAASRRSDAILGVGGSTIGAFTQLFVPGSDIGADFWVAFASSPLSSETVTITQTHNFDNVYDLFGVSGSNRTSLTGAFDAGGPQVSATAPIGITTVNANTLVIATIDTNVVTSPGASSGYTVVPNSNTDAMVTTYKLLTGTATESAGTNGNDGFVASSAIIAVVQATSGRLKFYSSLNGLGASGGFFHDRLAA